MGVLVAYKWVKDHGDGLWRSWSLPPDHPLSVVYRPGEWVEAPCGGLFAFPRQRDAEDGLAGIANSKFMLWRCHVMEEEEVPIPFHKHRGAQYVLVRPRADAARLYWSRRSGDLGSSELAPDGVRAYRRVMLVEPAWDIYRMSR